MRKSAQNHYKAADNAYAFGRYALADSLLKLAIESEKNFIDAHWMKGVINNEGLRNFDEATKELKIVVQLNPNYDRQLYLMFGHALFNKGDYDEAKKSFQTFLGIKGVTPNFEQEAKTMIKNCDFAKEAVKHPVAFKPINLGGGIDISSRIPYSSRWQQVAVRAAATGRRRHTWRAPLIRLPATMDSSLSSPARATPPVSGGGPSKSRRIVAPTPAASR